MSTNLKRRKLLATTRAVFCLLPFAAFSSQVRAVSNPALRAQLQYQDSPQQGRACSTCLEFVAGKTDQAPGSCKLIPKDDEISPNGYCVAWNTL